MNLQLHEFSNIIINNNENNDFNANVEQKISKGLSAKLYLNRYNADYIISKIIEHNNPFIFTYASKSTLQNNYQFIVKAIKANYKVMAHVNDDYKKDLDCLNALLSEDIDARIVEFIDPAIKNNQIKMEHLVRVKFDVFLYADERIKKSTDLARNILKNKHAVDCLKYFDPSILFDVKFINETIGKYSNELIHLAKINDGLNDENFIIKLAHAAGGKFDFSILNDELKNNAHLMKRLLEEDFELEIDYLGESLKNNKDFAIDIFAANPKNLKLLKNFSEEIQNDWDVLVSSFARVTNVERFTKNFKEFPNNKLKELMEDKDFIKFALSTNRLFYLMLSDEFKNDPEFALSYLKESESLNDITEKLGLELQRQIANNGDFLLNIEEVNPKLYNTLLNFNIACWTNKMKYAID